MTETVTRAHLPALGAHERGEAASALQATLVELIDLSLLGKQLHWTVVGPHFRPLHLQLDELIDSWRELADTVAERASAIGIAPDGQAATVAAGSGLDPVEVEPLGGEAVLERLTPRLQSVAENVRERMDRLGEIDDASQDVLVEVVRELEKQLWMVGVQLEK